ncbi:radical SAM protein [Okeania sp.]|uniref:SPL family radical SAM protein n=1 Tax=Okeania sp. TaxID=3100323 RepID=UPI002B4B034C|nr:radical SAM protein [Okeania sp.]MEB3340416.1 radical SAM protein [Okeania sp.]
MEFIDEQYTVITNNSLVVSEKFGSADVYGQNAKSILNKATGFIKAYDFTLNPYRGCQYGCTYCYAAAFSPNEKMQNDWGKWVLIKENAVEVLEKELIKWQKRNSDKLPSIYMSSVTDPYQPIESKTQLTRRLLEVMLEYKPILVIQTRSPMITRDIDILQRFKNLRINMSIPTGSESVRKDFEPQTPSIRARLNAMKKFKTKINDLTGYLPKLSITITPLLPTLLEEQESFIRELNFVDRVVIQNFHASHKRSLIASTRDTAIDMKKKYEWWYNNEVKSYQLFKNKLIKIMRNVEIKEGQAGFTYE